MAKHILPASVAAMGTAALVWNAISGVVVYKAVAWSPAVLAGASQVQQQMHVLTPQWVTAALVVAISSGLIGSLGLISGRRWASLWFGLSGAAVVLQMLGGYASASVREAMGISGLVFPALIFIVCAFLWSYAQSAHARGWLR